MQAEAELAEIDVPDNERGVFSFVCFRTRSVAHFAQQVMTTRVADATTTNTTLATSVRTAQSSTVPKATPPHRAIAALGDDERRTAPHRDLTWPAHLTLTLTLTRGVAACPGDDKRRRSQGVAGAVGRRRQLGRHLPGGRAQDPRRARHRHRELYAMPPRALELGPPSRPADQPTATCQQTSLVPCVSRERLPLPRPKLLLLLTRLTLPTRRLPEQTTACCASTRCRSPSSRRSSSSRRCR